LDGEAVGGGVAVPHLDIDLYATVLDGDQILVARTVDAPPNPRESDAIRAR